MQRSKFYRWFIAASVLLSQAACVSTASSHDILEFFGFQSKTATPAPTATVPASEPKAQPTPAANEWDDWDLDPQWMDDPLFEPDEDDLESKQGSWFSDEDWDDPFAYSSNPERFDDVPLGEGSEMVAHGPGPEVPYYDQPYPPAYPTCPQPICTPTPHPPIPQPIVPAPQTPVVPQQQYPVPGSNVTWYPVNRPPVFNGMHQLPCTGLTGREVFTGKEDIAYSRTNMMLTIPELNLSEEIVMVPRVDDEFQVSGLGYDIGLLEGSSPSSDGLFVLAGHNHLNAVDQGPFYGIGKLKESDLIFVTGAKGASRTFVVYANEKVPEGDIDGLLSYTKPGAMVLITCEDEALEGGYLNRRVIFAEPREN